MVKVPVALAVMHAVDRGEVSLDTRVTLRAADFVDGAGTTNSMAPGTALSVRHLLEQMIIYSDNTASDMLIELAVETPVNLTSRQKELLREFEKHDTTTSARELACSAGSCDWIPTQ